MPTAQPGSARWSRQLSNSWYTHTNGVEFFNHSRAGAAGPTGPAFRGAWVGMEPASDLVLLQCGIRHTCMAGQAVRECSVMAETGAQASSKQGDLLAPRIRGTGWWAGIFIAIALPKHKRCWARSCPSAGCRHALQFHCLHALAACGGDCQN